MVTEGGCTCPYCLGLLKPYDRVYRIVRTRGGLTKRVRIRRFVCGKCGRVHRALPSYILPFKHYESEIIDGVINGYITCETLGYEDNPCEATMARWSAQKIHVIL